MSLSSLIGSLTRRDADASSAPRRPISNPSSSPDVMALVEAKGLRFVPRGDDRSLGAQRDGVTFDEEGHGAFARTGYTVTFDTGCEDFVARVRVQISGGVAAMPPLQRLAAKTGWRLESDQA
jgi:hypothetical protein